MPPLIHIHGALKFARVCFYFVQTALLASGRTIDHRSRGLAGIALFDVIACAILVGEIALIKRDEAAGMDDGARRFAAFKLRAWSRLPPRRPGCASPGLLKASPDDYCSVRRLR